MKVRFFFILLHSVLIDESTRKKKENYNDEIVYKHKNKYQEKKTQDKKKEGNKVKFFSPI